MKPAETPADTRRMKIVVTTTYQHVDEEWFDSYMNHLRSGPPEVRGIVDHLIKTGRAAFRTPDPTSKVIGTTTYEVIDESI